MESNDQKESGNILVVLAVVILILVVGAGSYYIGTKNQLSSNTPTPTQSLAPISTTTPAPTPTVSLKTYTNKSVGISLKYPETLYLTEPQGGSPVFTFEPYPEGEGPGPMDVITLYSNLNLDLFNSLFNAKEGDDVEEAHGAIDVKVTKIRNFKIDGFDAVEYIRDGLTPPKSGLGRGPIGYEHHVIIKKSYLELINLVNQTMEVEKTKQRDPIFNSMVESIQIIK